MTATMTEFFRVIDQADLTPDVLERLEITGACQLDDGRWAYNAGRPRDPLVTVVEDPGGTIAMVPKEREAEAAALGGRAIEGSNPFSNWFKFPDHASARRFVGA